MSGGASPRRRGDAYERKIKSQLEAEGWYVMRSPASRSPIDLLCARPTSKRPGDVLDVSVVLAVQAKLAGRIDPAERLAVIEVAKAAGGLPVLAHRRPTRFSLITEKGTEDLHPGVMSWQKSESQQDPLAISSGRMSQDS